MFALLNGCAGTVEVGLDVTNPESCGGIVNGWSAGGDLDVAGVGPDSAEAGIDIGCYNVFSGPGPASVDEELYIASISPAVATPELGTCSFMLIGFGSLALWTLLRKRIAKCFPQVS